MYSNVVSNTRKHASPNQLKNCIQIYALNLFKHKNEENTVVYAVMTNSRELVGYIKSVFIASCLKGPCKASKE
jgi:hypothetical protein